MKEQETFSELNSTTDQIQVVIAENHAGKIYQQQIEVSKLVFWHQQQVEHLVTPLTIVPFLKHAGMYGASIFLNQDNTACYSLDSSIQFEKGEYPVTQIYYQGELVYTQSKPSKTNKNDV